MSVECCLLVVLLLIESGTECAVFPLIPVHSVILVTRACRLQVQLHSFLNCTWARQYIGIFCCTVFDKISTDVVLLSPSAIAALLAYSSTVQRFAGHCAEYP